MGPNPVQVILNNTQSISSTWHVLAKYATSILSNVNYCKSEINVNYYQYVSRAQPMKMLYNWKQTQPRHAKLLLPCDYW